MLRNDDMHQYCLFHKFSIKKYLFLKKLFYPHLVFLLWDNYVFIEYFTGLLLLRYVHCIVRFTYLSPKYLLY